MKLYPFKDCYTHQYSSHFSERRENFLFHSVGEAIRCSALAEPMELKLNSNNYVPFNCTTCVLINDLNILIDTFTSSITYLHIFLRHETEGVGYGIKCECHSFDTPSIRQGGDHNLGSIFQGATGMVPTACSGTRSYQPKVKGVGWRMRAGMMSARSSLLPLTRPIRVTLILVLSMPSSG